MKLSAYVKIEEKTFKVETREHMTIEAALEEMARAMSKTPDKTYTDFTKAYMPRRAGVNQK